jgi:DNA polymerase I-like protein with 3'-5' exonuclease and polymerase domains
MSDALSKAYAQNDVRYLHRLQQRLSTQLGEAKLATVFRLETALLPIIARMEANGFAVDADGMRSLRQEADARAAGLLPEIRSSFNNDKLNPGSPKQIVDAFNATSIGITDSKEETLAGLDDPRAAKLLAWREHSKLSGMIATLLAAERGGRIHAEFNPIGSWTTPSCEVSFPGFRDRAIAASLHGKTHLTPGWTPPETLRSSRQRRR